ncbi:MAG: LTA synthase family protein [Betaproteobacteria bacterium]|nr:LTA synthase family protein [Betaproteobacteria bacterium]
MFPDLSRNPYYPFLKAYLFGLIFFSLSRLGLIFSQLDAVTATDKFLDVILQGVRVDLIQLGLVFLIPLLIFPLSFINGQTKHIYHSFLRLWIILSFIILFIIEACSITFINEYNTRPNVLFLEYLKYPREVFEMLFKGFTLDAILVIGSVLLVSRLIIVAFRRQNEIEYKLMHLVIWPVVIVLILISIRSSFGHRPANPAMFAITDNAMVNSLVLNSPYSVFYAAYSMKHEASASKVYGKMDIEKIYSLTSQNGPAEYPTQKTLTPSYQGKPKNIVILLQESLGATFVESLGGVPVTPNLEKLKNEGIWFSQLYATGTRSVRGIEAVISGFPPTPAQSTVKLPLSQSNFFTLASLLNEKNYETSFIYGGEAHFDNMRNFFTGNGFKKIIEQKDFTNPIFKGSWGVSDQDLYQKAHEEFLERHSQNQPFFSLVFTSSNHAPFEFPEGVIDLYEQPQATEKNAVKYADHALGEFIQKAKQSPVTMLSLAGIHARHPMIGQDMSAIDHNYRGRAIMQYYDNFAWMEPDELFVLQPNQEIFYGKYDFMNNTIIPNDQNNINYDKQLAHALLPSILYSQKLYRLPPQ